MTQVGDDVDRGLLGRKVVAHIGNEGGYADRAVVAAEAVSHVPDGLDLFVAAALLHDGPTALTLFDVTKVGPEDTVLVVGASGGLGVLSVQLGRGRAARVVAIARGSKLDRVRELGPDAGADVVLDNVGGDLGEASFAIVAAGGRFSGHGTPSGRFAHVDQPTANRRSITVSGIEAVQMSDNDLQRYTDQALREAASGTIVPVIGQTFPLEQTGSAHAAIQGRDIFGKTLLTTTA